MMNNKNLPIGFIGAGRVGCTLGRFFYEKNLPLSGYFSKTQEHAVQASEFTNSKSYRTIQELAEESRVIFITTPDESIYETYLLLRQYDLKDKILCHCSGALSSAVFEEIEQIGAYAYSVHPAFAVSDKYNSYREISKAFFTVEGNNEKMHIIKEIMETLGNPFAIINAENKYKYHASLAMASNLVISLYHISLSLLEECGFSASSAEKVLNPLFLNNAKAVCEKGCVNALTGPVDRNDKETVMKHLSVLDQDNIPAIYKLLSAELLSLAKEKNPEKDYGEMTELLK